MEMNGEQIIKKGKKLPSWLWIGYIVCIAVIIAACYFMDYKEQNQKPEPIDFTTEEAIGMQTNQYAYLDVEGLSTEVAIYGNAEDENDSTNDRYYIAFNKGYMYIVDLDFETIDQLKQWQDYMYSTDENISAPEPVTIYGMTEEISDELKQIIVDYYNEGIDEEYKINISDFEKYFGSVLLNVRRSPVNTSTEETVMIIAILGIFVLIIFNISIIVVKGRVKKYLKKNGYEEELARQLDDNVEEKYYKDKVIFTKDFFIDIKREKFIAFRYDDVKWVHIHNVKYYGTVTVSTSIIVHLKDGKTNFQCVQINGNSTDEFLKIYDRICEKVPGDCLKGFTVENQKEFKNYKKEIKKRNIIPFFSIHVTFKKQNCINGEGG